MKKILRYTIICVFIIQFNIITGHSQEEYELPLGISMLKSQKNNEIVAQIGDINITVGEFKLNYEFGPAFIKRSNDSRKRYLELMINEKILALEAYKQKLHETLRVKNTLIEIHKDLITEELYKDDVMAKISVTATELQDGVTKSQQNFTLKWIFTTQATEIIKYKNQIDNGTSFDNLYSLQFTGSITEDDRQLTTTRFKLKYDNPLLSMVVDTMVAGNYSNPIKVNDGWYLIKIDNEWSNAIITESEIIKERHHIERKIFKSKVDKLSDQYVHQMMLDHDATIVRENLNLLRNYLAHKIVRPEKYQEWLHNKKLNQIPTQNKSIKDIENFKSITLITYKNGKLLLHEFYDWYKAREQYIKFATATPEKFYGSLQTIIWQMLRDQFLAKKAIARRLGQREIVAIQQKWWEHKILYSAMKEQIAAAIQPDEKDIYDYYLKNKANYKYKNNKIIPYDKIKNNIKSDYLKKEYMIEIYRKIKQLKSNYSIEIYDTALCNLYIAEEENPQAIDVYVVKKGGSLPRQAFPTIDWEWRNWF